MQREQYCVYNQTNECFLSLGAMRGAIEVARLKRMLGKVSRVDEGCWISPPSGLQTLAIVSSRDLIYLDADCKVVDVLESFPPLRTAPSRKDAASLLALPVHTISSSQTRPGNQLLICAPEEMEWRLRDAPDLESSEAPAKARCRTTPSPDWLPGHQWQERRTGERSEYSCPVAYFSAGGELAVNVIRNLSATGLYLVTHERWPLGSQVKMSLQRTDDVSQAPITVQMRVARWGADGVGLEFIQPGMEHSQLMHMHVC